MQAKCKQHASYYRGLKLGIIIGTVGTLIIKYLNPFN